MPANPVETSTLLQLYESGLSLQAVGDRVGLTRQAVHIRLKSIGYKPRPKGPRIRFDRETLIGLYVEKGLPVVQVAYHLNSSLAIVGNQLERHGIARRRRGPLDKYRIYFDQLEKAGDAVMIPWEGKPNPHPILHKVASRLGLKVSIKKAGDDQMKVTRVEGSYMEMPIPVNNAELLHLYEDGMTLKQIADRYGVKKQAVHGRLKKSIGYKPRPPHTQRRNLDRETLVDLYVTKELSLPQVAKHLKADRGTVRNELIRHGIERRRRGGRSKYAPYFAKLSEIGDSVLIPWKYPYYAHKTLHEAAGRFGIKVSVKKAGDSQMRVTRKG